MLLALVFAVSAQLPAQGGATAFQAPDACPPKLEIAAPLLLYSLGQFADLASTGDAELQGATEGNGAVVLASKYKFGLISLKGAAAIAETGGDVATQWGARKGLWPTWMKWVYRGVNVAIVGAVVVHNERVARR